MKYNPKDFYFKKAKSENYVARSVFKLQEINDRYKVIKKGDQVLDLGAAPGSWSQFASEQVGQNGKVIGIDLQPIRLTLPNAFFYCEDIKKFNLEKVIQENKMRTTFDVILSDMAPKTSGVRITDQARSLELCELALEMALKHLKLGGHFICKLFHGEDFEEFRDRLKLNFNKVEVMRPKSTRKESKEIYFIALQTKTKL
jgi:23S rRNA (uridine2552-2'-O)-methyltransferase